MPRKCCVLTCRSNKKIGGPYINVFAFPKNEELKTTWLRRINRNNFNPSKYSAVCIKHFEEKFIERVFRATRPDESVLVMPRSKLALTSDAFPTIFESPPVKAMSPRKQKSQDTQTSRVKVNLLEKFTIPCNQTSSVKVKLPEELTTPCKQICSENVKLAVKEVTSGRKTPSVKKKLTAKLTTRGKKTSSRKELPPAKPNASGWTEEQQTCEEEAAHQAEIHQFAEVNAHKEWHHTFSIENFAFFKEQVEKKLPEHWLVIRNTASDIYLGKHHFSGAPKLLVAVKINSDLKVVVWHDGTLLDDSNFGWLLGEDMRCDLWTTFDCLLSYLESYNTTSNIKVKHEILDYL